MEPLNKIPKNNITIGDSVVKEIIYNNEKVYPIYDSGLKFIEWVASSTSFHSWMTSSTVHRDDFLEQLRTINIRVVMDCDLFTNWKVESDPYFNGQSELFGTRVNYNDREYRCIVGGSYANNEKSIGLNAWNYDGGYRYDNTNPYYNVHEFHKVEVNGVNLYIDNQLICNCRSGDNKYNGKLNPWTPYGGKRKIKNTTMWIDGVKIYKYQAAKKDGIYGIYDIVGNKFYGDESFIGSE